MSLNIEVLEQSFERVKPHTTEFASSFYNNLFTDYPQFRPLFANTTMEDQEKKFIWTLVLVVENLRKPDYLKYTLKSLGERHVRYGTKREYYPIVGEVLLKTFESYLGPDWTLEAKQAWTDAYEAVVNLMLEGTKYPETVLKLENALQHSPKPVEMGFAPMSLNIEVLEQSFERVKPHATEFASSFYNNLFTDYPQFRPLFANTTMEDQEKKFIWTLVLVVENLRKPDYLKYTLKSLGERHVRYGTKREYYPIVGEVLLKTFESYLGPDWTLEAKQAWTDAYEAVVNLMLEGTKYPETVLKLENALQHSPKPVEMGFATQQAPATASSVNYSKKISKLEKVSQLSAKPVEMGFATQQAPATTSSLNRKPLLIIFVLTGLLGVGLLYYHSSSKQDNSSLESSIAKTT